MSSPAPFHKYEGLGNDFIVFELDDADAISTEQAAQLCDRRFGVGGDGVILVLPSRAPDCVARMRVINADGSVPEMCGNGVRCVALHLLRTRGGDLEASSRVVPIDTDAGPRRCEVDDTGGEGLVTVDMGTVRVAGDAGIDLDGQRVTFTVADAGNPHAVLLGTFARGDVERLGPRIATHASFPRGTNVEFARVAEGRADLIVWERGVGITLACGTGACATAAVACEKGLLPKGKALPIRLPGGTLEVTIGEGGTATMRGPARRVFSGAVDLAPPRGLR
jgi:diaminopimelate epimerase